MVVLSLLLPLFAFFMPALTTDTMITPLLPPTPTPPSSTKSSLPLSFLFRSYITRAHRPPSLLPSFPNPPPSLLPPKIKLNLITTPSSPHPPMARPRPPPRRRRRRHPHPILLLLLLLLLLAFLFLPTLPSSGPCISDEHPGLVTRLEATGLCFTCLLG